MGATSPSRAKPHVVLLVCVLSALILAGGPGCGEKNKDGASAASAKPAAGGGPMEVEGLRLSAQPLKVTVPVNGSLLANETVAIASELSRRVVKVLAEDGALVKRGQLLFQLDAADLHAEARQLEVQKRLLADQLSRQAKLRADGLASESDLERARSDLELINAKLESLGVTLSRTAIRAPFDGRLGLRNVSVGAMVSPATTLVTLKDTSRIKIDLSLPERHAAYVHEGVKFSFRTAAGRVHEATVVALESRIDESTRSLRVRGLADNTSGDLRPGSFVSIDFPIELRAGAVTVPALSIIPGFGGHQVWREQDGKAVLVPVEIGVRSDVEVEVVSGLKPGDVVLTSNLLRLRAGGPITVGRISEQTTHNVPAPSPDASAPGAE